MKSVRIIAILALLLGTAALASADVTWTLQNVVFERNPNAPFAQPFGTATGSFTVNSTLSGLTSWDITVAGSGFGGSADYHYKNTNAGDGVFFGTASLSFFNLGFTRFLILNLDSAVTNAGGSINVSSSSLDCQGCGEAVSGYVTSEPVSQVPEPGSLMLLGSGLAGLAGMIRRKIA